MLITISLRAVLFYLIPLSWGGLILSLHHRFFQHHSQRENDQSIRSRLISTMTGSRQSVHEAENNLFMQRMTEITLNFSLGLVVVICWALICQLIDYLLIPNSFTNLFFTVNYVVFVGMSFKFVIDKIRLLTTKHLFVKNLAAIIIALALASLAASWLWARTTASPLNWDLFEHQTLATVIQDGSFSFFTSQLSDTFGFMSYPPTFHALLALGQFGMPLTGENILRFWSELSLVHSISVAFACFGLSLVATKRRDTSIISAIFGVFIFEGVMAFTSHFPLPQNLAATIWTLLLASLLWRMQEKKSTLPLLIIGSAVLLLTHFVIGSAGAILLWTVVVIRWFLNTHFFTSKKTVIFGLMILVACSAIFLSYAIDLSAINRGEAAAFSFSFFEKIQYLWEMYALLPLLLIPAVWKVMHEKQSALSENKIILAITIILFSVILSGIPYAFKFVTLLHFPLMVLFAIGLSWSLTRIPQWISVGTALIVSALLLTNTAFIWQQELIADGLASQVSQDDLQAALFLQTNYDAKKTLIISDPSTQYILEGLSGINSVGGAFADQSQRQILREQYASAAINVDSLGSLSDKVEPTPTDRLLILSGRTYNWFTLPQQEQDALDFNVWRPARLSFYDQEITDAIVKNQNLKVVYQNQSHTIIAL